MMSRVDPPAPPSGGASPRARTSLALILCLAAGCVPSLSNNPPREPNRAIPAAFTGTPQATSAAQATYASIFESPTLQELIGLALQNNQELSLALQEIIVARSEAYARTGEYLPRVDAYVGVGVEKVGEHTSQGVGDEDAGLAQNLGDFRFGLRASWEVDIWKKLRNGAKAANLRYLETGEARSFLITQIVAELARSYFEMIALDNELDILDRNIALQTESLEAVRLQWQASKVTQLAVQRFEAEVLKNQSHRAELQQERTQAENRINFLVGRYPQPVPSGGEEFRRLVPKAVGVGLPSELLTNRPDVRAAELELQAAQLDVAAAKAEFYPALSIDAELGYESFNPLHLIDTPASLAYRVMGGLVAPLINRRGLKARYQTANAMQLKAVVQYEKTVLQAFTDVVNQLAMVTNLQTSYIARQQQVEKLTAAGETVNLLFQSTRADYVEVLGTRRDALEAELELAETKKQQFLAMVNLYQALGGGWRTSP